MKQLAVVNANNLTLALFIARYPQGGALFLELACEDGEPYTTVSVNLRPYGAQHEDDEVAVKTWSENEDIVEPVLATGLFEDTGRRVQAGFCQAHIWKLRDRALLPK